ncbi:hypothetical protein ABBQ32_009858 [Trebouxia sp. C0010 RCD-2024]
MQPLCALTSSSVLWRASGDCCFCWNVQPVALHCKALTCMHITAAEVSDMGIAVLTAQMLAFDSPNCMLCWPLKLCMLNPFSSPGLSLQSPVKEPSLLCAFRASS